MSENPATGATGTRPSNIAAIENATGLSWTEIEKAMRSAGGAGLEHHAMARVAADLFEGRVANHEWWAQGAAVAYEQVIGRRIPGQMADGTFKVSASKTYSGDPDEALAALTELFARLGGLDGDALAGDPSTSVTPKWRYWRATLASGTKLTATISAKAPGASAGSSGAKAPHKSTVAVEASKLPSPEAVQAYRQKLKEALGGLR
ncbi:hypothetical protein [Brevibacterium samyangense]|uniref:Uncharacterized protein n=1 Tax=Brevibacterium samyangense TaxID=366888 RepID=A0ABP5EWP1_9MICO